jgi:hypothetical protein
MTAVGAVVSAAAAAVVAEGPLQPLRSSPLAIEPVVAAAAAATTAAVVAAVVVATVKAAAEPPVQLSAHVVPVRRCR